MYNGPHYALIGQNGRRPFFVGDEVYVCFYCGQGEMTITPLDYDEPRCATVASIDSDKGWLKYAWVLTVRFGDGTTEAIEGEDVIYGTEKEAWAEWVSAWAEHIDGATKEMESCRLRLNGEDDGMVNEHLPYARP